MLCALALGGCDGDGLSTADPVWTLYVAGPAGGRGHMATFDAEGRVEGVDGNADRCEAVLAALAMRNDGRRYWCELGRFQEVPR